MKYKKILLISIVIITLLYLPNFLICSDIPIKSDVIVIFLGDHAIGKREQEARTLLLNLYSKKLLIPVNGKIIDSNTLRRGTKLHKAKYIKLPNIILKKNDPEKYKFYEATHIELLNTKTMMEHLNIKSAIFVSSPYHMRRIKIISDRIFTNSSHTISFVPTRFEGTKKANKFSSNDIKWVVSEYLKIAWFMAYEPWVKS